MLSVEQSRKAAKKKDKAQTQSTLRFGREDR